MGAALAAKGGSQAKRRHRGQARSHNAGSQAFEIQSSSSGFGEVISSNLRDVRARSIHATRSELHKMTIEVARFTDCKLQGTVAGSNFTGLKCTKPVRMVSQGDAMSWHNVRGIDISACRTAKGWIVHTFDFEGSLTAFATYCKRRNLTGLAEMVAYFTFKENYAADH